MAISNFNGVSWSTLTKVGGVLKASIVSVGGVTASSVDPDAQAFITAAGITNPTQQTAINDLVIGLKTDNLWDNMQAIYPFVGGTSTSHKYNLKDPRDLDVAKRLIFNGGWTHNANGIIGNGVNTYAETFNNNPFSMGAYSRTNGGTYNTFLGRQDTFIEDEVTYSYTNTLYSSNFVGNFYNNFLLAPYTKFYSVISSNSSAANELKIYRDGVSVLPTSLSFNSPWLPTNTFVLGAVKNSTYTLGNFTGNNYIEFGTANLAFVYFNSTILDATQNANLNTRVEAFQTALSRQVIDPDAQAFITTAGITNTTQQNAIDNLVIGLKADGLWEPMNAIYPFVGGTASKHQWNLKNLSNYNLVFGGGWTHNANGAEGNGIDTYADTNFGLDQGQIGVYNRGGVAIFGTQNNYQNVPEEDYPIYGSPQIYSVINSNSGYSYFTNTGPQNFGYEFQGRVNSTGTNLNLGLLSLAGNNSQTTLYRNGVVNTTTTPYQSVGSSYSIWLGGCNAVWNGWSYAPDFKIYGDSQLAFGFITTTVLNGTQNTNLYNRVRTFQMALSRQVIDPDAQAFITAAGITNTTQQNAIDNLVVGLKADSLWTTMQALYPFVGGTASSHKYNLKDPRDLDVAYRLAFFGGWTHDANGVTPNGTNAYADTFYNSPNSFGVYLKTFTPTKTWLAGIAEYRYIDTDFDTLSQILLTGNQLNVVNNNNYYYMNVGSPYNQLYSVVRSPFKFYRNGVSATAQTPILPTLSINYVLGAIRNAQYDNGVFSFYYINGYGGSNMAFAYYSSTNLDATQNTNLNNRVVAFQTALNRQV
jgi:hypothetical protein